MKPYTKLSLEGLVSIEITGFTFKRGGGQLREKHIPRLRELPNTPYGRHQKTIIV
jgi:hypothetical protein